MKLLILEDSLVQQRCILRAIKAHVRDISFVICNSLSDAIEFAGIVDCAVLDVMLPDNMDDGGLEPLTNMLDAAGAPWVIYSDRGTNGVAKGQLRTLVDRVRSWEKSEIA